MLCCIALHCIVVLCCSVLCYAVLCCAVLCCAVLCCAVLCCAALLHATQCYAIKFRTADSSWSGDNSAIRCSPVDHEVMDSNPTHRRNKFLSCARFPDLLNPLSKIIIGFWSLESSTELGFKYGYISSLISCDQWLHRRLGWKWYPIQTETRRLLVGPHHWHHTPVTTIIIMLAYLYCAAYTRMTMNESSPPCEQRCITFNDDGQRVQLARPELPVHHYICMYRLLPTRPPHHRSGIITPDLFPVQIYRP